jgi:beta-N-acetylhexosaminidase
MLSVLPAAPLSMREKVAQLMVLPFYGEAPNSASEEYGKYIHRVKGLGIGGLVLVNRIESGRVRHAEPFAIAAFVNRMQRAAKVPLLVAGDFERSISMRVVTATRFPHAMAFAAAGDAALSREQGAITARQARALGIPWIFAPVADVNNNPDNPIINIRSYGEDPREVAAHVRAFMDGARTDPKHPVLVTAKHFPGHGDTATDSHLALPVLNAAVERLESVELAPFRAAIDGRVDAIMSAHIAVPALDQPGLPATLSPRILTGLLRGRLGFAGLIVTDALDMQGITKHWRPGEAAVKSLQAGADVLLMPPDPEAAIDAVLRAVEDGRISAERIDESVNRVLALKTRLGLERQRFVDLEALMDVLDSPSDLTKAQEVADRAVTLVKNENGVVPLRDAASACFVVLAESRSSDSGRVFASELRKRAAAARVAIIDPATAEDFDMGEVRGCETIVVPAFAAGATLAGGHPALLKALIETGRPVVLVALGNPYLVRSYPRVHACLATFSTVPTSEVAALKAVLGEMAIRGRLPVTIPGIAKYGDGIQAPPR